METEKMQVLKMLEDGKITSEDAAKLLGALEVGEPEAVRPARWIRVKVWDRTTGRSKVSVNVPVSLVSMALKLIPVGLKFVPDDEIKGKIDAQELTDAIREALKIGAVGKIAEVEDDKENVRVEVSID